VSSSHFRIGRSRTGLGLFATKPIRKGAFVVAYTGRRIPDAEARKLEDRSSRYIFEINTRWSIDGKSRRNTGRYVNHSCRPNVEPVFRGHRIHYRSRRRIKPGEEITVDYGKDYFVAFIGKSRCQCEKCRERRSARRSELRAKKKRALLRQSRERAARRKSVARRPRKRAA
jgi:SET domain-containing protein